MSDDATWLRQYAKEGSDEAFRKLVERHIQLVNATARRILAGDTHLADDVTQLVFTDLARKAASLPEDVILGGWLYRHTCYTALKAIRAENRRRTRERTAMEITALNDSSAGDAQWAQLAPVLDDALSQLGAEDRDAIVLRYLQQQDVRSIGLALGASENAAQKRLGRALEKLRAILTRRGVTVSTVLLSTALDVGAATAPVSSGLVASVSTIALSGAATSATATTLTLASLKTMTTTKLTLGIAATVLVAGITTIVVRQNNPTITLASPAPVAQSASVALPSSTPAKAVTVAKVEAPKVAPAPAGGEPLPDNMPANDPFDNSSGFSTTKSGSGTLSLSATDASASGRAVGGSVSFNAGSGRRQIVAGTSGTRASSVAVVNGQMVITTNRPDGTVDTQTIPVATTNGGKQAVLSFVSTNGAGQIISVPNEPDPANADATVVDQGTFTIMDNASTNGPSTGTVVIFGNGPASDSTSSSNP